MLNSIWAIMVKSLKILSQSRAEIYLLILKNWVLTQAPASSESSSDQFRLTSSRDEIRGRWAASYSRITTLCLTRVASTREGRRNIGLESVRGTQRTSSANSTTTHLHLTTPQKTISSTNLQTWTVSKTHTSPQLSGSETTRDLSFSWSSCLCSFSAASPISSECNTKRRSRTPSDFILRISTSLASNDSQLQKISFQSMQLKDCIAHFGLHRTKLQD